VKGGTPIGPVWPFAFATISFFDDQIGREVLKPDLGAFLLPQAGQRLFVLAHDDAGVGAADEVKAVGAIPSFRGIS
jgi:hypothetical protein